MQKAGVFLWCASNHCHNPPPLSSLWGVPIAQFGECRTLDRKVAGSILTQGAAWCCVLKQDTSIPLLRTGKTKEAVPKLLKNCWSGRKASNKSFIIHDQIKLSDLDKSRMKHGGLLNKYICDKKIQISPVRQQKLSIFHFSHYKSMGTINCHSNQSSYPTGIKNITYIEANVLSMYAKFQLQPPYGFFTFLGKLALFATPTTNQIHWFGQKLYET